jgi:hypothetical protein
MTQALQSDGFGMLSNIVESSGELAEALCSAACGPRRGTRAIIKS